MKLKSNIQKVGLKDRRGEAAEIEYLISLDEYIKLLDKLYDSINEQTDDYENGYDSKVDDMLDVIIPRIEELLNKYSSFINELSFKNKVPLIFMAGLFELRNRGTVGLGNENIVEKIIEICNNHNCDFFLEFNFLDPFGRPTGQDFSIFYIALFLYLPETLKLLFKTIYRDDDKFKKLAEHIAGFYFAASIRSKGESSDIEIISVIYIYYLLLKMRFGDNISIFKEEKINSEEHPYPFGTFDFDEEINELGGARVKLYDFTDEEIQELKSKLSIRVGKRGTRKTRKRRRTRRRRKTKRKKNKRYRKK